MAWSQEVPLLGFDDEHYVLTTRVPRSVLSIRVPGVSYPIQVYAWGGGEEGYNIFFPSGSIIPSCQVRTPFEAKLLIQEYINRKGE